jgi:hypothetical protein
MALSGKLVHPVTFVQGPGEMLLAWTAEQLHIGSRGDAAWLLQR